MADWPLYIDDLDLHQKEGFATPSRVQAKYSNPPTAEVVTPSALDNPVSEGNALIIIVIVNGADLTTPEGYTLIDQSVTGWDIYTFAKFNCNAGEPMPAFVFDSGQNARIGVLEYANVSSVDVHGGATGGAGNPAATGNLTTTQDNEVLLAVLSTGNTSATMSGYSNGYSFVISSSGASTGSQFNVAEKIVSAIGTAGTTFTLSGSPGWYVRQFTLRSSPTGQISIPPSGFVRLSAKPKAGKPNLYWKDDEGNEWDLGEHGASQHSPTLRSIWLSKEQFTLDSGTASTIGTAPDIAAIISLSASAIQGAYVSLTTPRDILLGLPIAAAIYWVNVAADVTAHAVRWQFDAKEILLGGVVSAAQGLVPWTGDSLARSTAGTLFTEKPQTLVTPTDINSIIRLNVRRVGSDAADTFTGAAGLIGLRLDYMAVA